MQNLHEKFISPSDELSVQELISFLDEDLLNYEFIPEEYFSFLAGLFMQPKFFHEENLWKLLHFLMTENLTDIQFKIFSEILSKNFFEYKQYMLCDMACDFICRCRPAETALEILELMASHKLENMHVRTILSGLNSLLNRGRLDSSGASRVHNLANKIAPKNNGRTSDKNPRL